VAAAGPLFIIDPVEAIYASARRIGVLIGGSVLLVAGLAMLVLPGPGVAAIIAGLALLGTQFEWARRASGWLRDRLDAVFAAVKLKVLRSR
jgi:uncharacterized protein (TIGR02611 family)